MSEENPPLYSRQLDEMAGSLFISTYNMNLFLDMPDRFLEHFEITDPREIDCIAEAVRRYPTSHIHVTDENRGRVWVTLFTYVDECLSRR